MWRRTTWIIPLAMILLVVGYGFFEARSLMTGPIVSVTHPSPGMTVEGPTYEIRGTIANVTHISLNGQPITTDLSGAFLETRVTPDGIGTILVEAKDRFGRVKRVQFDIWGIPEKTPDTTEVQ